MKTIRLPLVVYELLKEQAKTAKYRSIEDYLNCIARGTTK